MIESERLAADLITREIILAVLVEVGALPDLSELSL
jgi:hypothetical protein